MSNVAIVTGTSSGIGDALARELLGRKWRVVGIARRAVRIADPNYTHLQLDLRDLAAVGVALDSQVAPLINDSAVTRIGLVNNAAMEALLGPIRTLDAAAMVDVFALNTAAPVLLMGWMWRHARRGVPLRIVNVSSGAAVIPFAGMAPYCSTKAALRMAGKILGVELDAAGSGPNGNPDATILSYEPGLVDTPMQTTARTSSAELLPSVQMFKDFESSGSLVAPSEPANDIADYLAADGHARWEERRYGGELEEGADR